MEETIDKDEVVGEDDAMEKNIMEEDVTEEDVMEEEEGETPVNLLMKFMAASSEAVRRSTHLRKILQI